jgi:hypothetical protein
VGCIVVTVEGARTVQKQQGVSAGQSSMLSLRGLPLGTATFTAQAYTGACSGVSSSSVPSWLSDPVVVTLASGVAAQVTLPMRHNGQADVSVDFLADDCVPNPTCTPAPLPASGDPHKDCMLQINQLRACMCLPPLTRNVAAESCADAEAQYDSAAGVAHQGFVDGICQPGGSAQTECMGGALSSCLRTMFDLGPGSGTPNQYDVMMSTSYTQVACGLGGAGWTVQNYF